MPAKSNRWQRERIVIGNFRRLGRAEDELHVLRRLFQGLQQGVEGLAGEHVDFVDDVDLEPRAAGTNADVLTQLADLVDAAVAGPVDLQHVDVLARADALADVALVAGRRRGALFAIQRLGEDAGGGRLAHAPRPGEQIGVAYAVAGDRVLQRLGDVLLADQLRETLRAIPPRRPLRKNAAPRKGSDQGWQRKP